MGSAASTSPNATIILPFNDLEGEKKDIENFLFSLDIDEISALSTEELCRYLKLLQCPTLQIKRLHYTGEGLLTCDEKQIQKLSLTKPVRNALNALRNQKVPSLQISPIVSPAASPLQSPQHSPQHSPLNESNRVNSFESCETPKEITSRKSQEGIPIRVKKIERVESFETDTSCGEGEAYFSEEEWEHKLAELATWENFLNSTIMDRTDRKRRGAYMERQPFHSKESWEIDSSVSTHRPSTIATAKVLDLSSYTLDTITSSQSGMSDKISIWTGGTPISDTATRFFPQEMRLDRSYHVNARRWKDNFEAEIDKMQKEYEQMMCDLEMEFSRLKDLTFARDVQNGAETAMQMWGHGRGSISIVRQHNDLPKTGVWTADNSDDENDFNIEALMGQHEQEDATNATNGTLDSFLHKLGNDSIATGMLHEVDKLKEERKKRKEEERQVDIDAISNPIMKMKFEAEVRIVNEGDFIPTRYLLPLERAYEKPSDEDSIADSKPKFIVKGVPKADSRLISDLTDGFITRQVSFAQVSPKPFENSLDAIFPASSSPKIVKLDEKPSLKFPKI